MSFTTDSGKLLVKEDITKVHPEGSQFYAIDRTKLIEVIKGSLNTTDVKMNTVVQKMIHHKESVDVTFSDGQAQTYDFVIVADGIHSHTRSLVDSSYSSDYGDSRYGANYLGIQIWRTIIPTQNDLKNPIYMLGSDTIFLLYPINDNKTYIYAHKVNERTGNNPNDEDHIAKLSELFKSYGGNVPKALSTIRELKPKVLSHYLETSKGTIWSKGKRILFMGDASRGFSPMLQNGAAQAFEDAYVLSELFKDNLKSSPEKIEHLYQKRREPRSSWVKKTSDNRIVALGKSHVEARNAAIRAKGAPNVTGFRVLMKENP